MKNPVMTGDTRGLFICYRCNALVLLRFERFNKTLTLIILNNFIYIIYLYQQNETNLFIMKYLQDYREQAQTNLFNQTGTFFAFSNSQFSEGKIKAKDNADVNGYEQGDKWTQMGGGMFTLSKHVEKVINDLDTINISAIAQDLKDNGINNIVLRELGNYESYYTGDITSAFEELEQYGVTKEQVYRKFKNKNYEIDLAA